MDCSGNSHPYLPVLSVGEEAPMILFVEDVYPPEPRHCDCGAPLPLTGKKGRPRKRCVTCAEQHEHRRLMELKARGQ